MAVNKENAQHRISINLNGAGHKTAPIPAACLIGNILISSAINGKDIKTDILPEEIENQIINAFANMDMILNNAGASLEEIGKLTIFLTNDNDRPKVNGEWLKRFSNEESRPARHIQITNLSHGMKIQIEVFAVLKDK